MIPQFNLLFRKNIRNPTNLAVPSISAILRWISAADRVIGLTIHFFTTGEAPSMSSPSFPPGGAPAVAAQAPPPKTDQTEGLFGVTSLDDQTEKALTKSR